MATERKDRGEESPEEINFDDVDFDKLLEEMESDKPPEEEQLSPRNGGGAMDKTGAPASGPAAEQLTPEEDLLSEEDLVDLDVVEDAAAEAGEVDLDELLAHAPDSSSGEKTDVLDLEETPAGGQEAFLAELAEEAAAPHSPGDAEELLAGDLAGDEDGSEPVEALAEPDFIEDAGGAPAGPASEREPEQGEEEALVPAAPGKKKGKFSRPDKGRRGGRLGAKERGSGARAGRAEKSKKERVPKPTRPAAQRSVRFVCSECYEEFLLPANFSRDTVSCPECLHVGKRPDEDFLRTINLHKAGERKALTLACALGGALLLLLLVLIWIQSPYRTIELKEDQLQAVTMGILGGSGLVAILFFWLLVRAENNRWEVYF
jgi:hypothetical protein